MSCANDFRTKLTSNGTGMIKEKSDVLEFNGVKTITLQVSFARRRQDSATGSVIVEEDVIPVKFWASGAEMIADLASVGQHIYVETEVRSRGSRLELKAKHFELLGSCK